MHGSALGRRWHETGSFMPCNAAFHAIKLGVSCHVFFYAIFVADNQGVTIIPASFFYFCINKFAAPDFSF